MNFESIMLLIALTISTFSGFMPDSMKVFLPMILNFFISAAFTQTMFKNYWVK